MIAEDLRCRFILNGDRSAGESFGQTLTGILAQKEIQRLFAAIECLTMMTGSERQNDQGFLAVCFLKRAAARFSVRLGSGGAFKASSTIRLSRAESRISGVNCAVAGRGFAGSLTEDFVFLIVAVAIA